MKLTPHFTFNGQSEEALNFYSKVFNGKIISLVRFSDMEDACCGMAELEPADKQRILNGCLQFGENMIYSCDQMPGQSRSVGSNIMMDISMPDNAELQRIFDELSKEGNVMIPLAPVAWSSLFGMVTDRYGICWNIFNSNIML